MMPPATTSIAGESHLSAGVMPLMVGGTGRSGTTVLSRLLGQHPQIRASWPQEIKFLNSADGLLDLAEARPAPVGIARLRMRKALGRGPVEALDAFADGMTGRWWERSNRLSRDSGLHLGIDRADVDRLLLELRERFPADPDGAARSFFFGFIEAQRNNGGEPIWVDTSPPNIANATRIHRLIPTARFIFMIRDGRATAASVMRERWGPNDPLEAIDWWRKRTVRAHRGLSGVPASQALPMSLEDLVIRDREGSYARLLDFLGIDDDPAMRTFFDEKMLAARLNPSGWREKVPDADAFERSYRVAAEQLRHDGIDPHEWIA
jgi:hypothetical protein